MTTMPIQLLPATSAPPATWPRLPGWWPLADPGPDPVTGEPRPQLTEGERDAMRRSRAHREACSGPLDRTEQRIEVTFGEGGPPRVYEPAPGFVYRLATDQPEGAVRYRYDPGASARHGQAMLAVESAYAEAEPGFAAMVREGVAQ